jgi:hypothetical protein
VAHSCRQCLLLCPLPFPPGFELEVEDVVVVVVDDEVVVVDGGGPDETEMSTALPGGTDAPAPGFDAMTTPGGYWEGAEETLPTVRPA